MEGFKEYLVVYAFKNSDSQLDLTVNDIIEVPIGNVDVPGWIKGKNKRTGVEGYYPVPYLTPLDRKPDAQPSGINPRIQGSPVKSQMISGYGGSPLPPVMAGQLHFKSGKTFCYQATIDDLIGRGAYGRVFKGHFKSNTETSWEEGLNERQQAAIKRVEINFQKEKWMDIESDREVVALKKLRHPFIVTLYAVEDDNNFRNFIFELCQANLEEFITKKYNGVMPEEMEGLYQMASGLKFIHDKKMIHRDIKPKNVLISLTGQIACLKIADLGFTKPLNQDGIHFDLASGLKGTEYYMAPELLVLRNVNRRVFDGKCTIATDVFAAGCTFFRYCAGGLHPFGKDYNIELNIMTRNPVNLTAQNLRIGDGKDPWKINLIREMIQFVPEKRLPFSEIVKRLADQFSPSFLQASVSDFQVNDMGFLQQVIEVQNSRTSDLITINGILELDRGNKIGKEYGSVYGGTFNGEKVAVKRVQIFESDVENRELEINQKLSRIHHPNIVQFIHYEQDDDFKYFVLELCVASLDQLFLPEDDPKKYSGPIPSDEQFCIQLISGLQYIHDENVFVHGSIKPTNILISSRNDPQIKLSDFGLTKTSRLNEGHTSQRSIGGFLSSRYWFAPELLDNGQNEATKESDIFAAGSVFFYFLSKGCHLFGDLNDIFTNTLEGIQSNLSRIHTQTQISPYTTHYYSIIRWMTTKDPRQRSTLTEVTEQMKLLFPVPAISSIEELDKIGDIQFSTEHLIGKGAEAVVFLGFSKGSIVAVKRIIIDSLNNKEKESVYRERDLFQKLNHRNIIKLIDNGENKTFMVLALEKCLTSLEIYCREPNVCRIIPMPTDREVLLQMAQGLEYIHSQNMIHRDVTPKNILISADNPAVIKWTDFGISRAAVVGSKTFSWTKLRGTDRWLAPELITTSREEKVKGSQKCDIFGLGCCFFFFLVPGIHPFGDSSDHSTQNNIMDQNAVNFDRLPIGHFASDIIKGMIENDRESRSKLPDVVQKLLKCTSS